MLIVAALLEDSLADERKLIPLLKRYLDKQGESGTITPAKRAALVRFR